MKQHNPDYTRQEMLVQAEVFRRCHGDILKLIHNYAEDFRNIINSFEEHFNKVPTADDLLWIASEHAHHDITKDK